MKKIIHKSGFLAGIFAIFLSGGCSTEEITGIPPGKEASIHFEIGSKESYARAVGDITPSVNRILILPFKKIDENAPNDTANFAPDYNKAKQLDVNSFPVIATIPALSASSTYMMMIIGYNRNDYDFTNQLNPSRRFSIGSVATPATLQNLYLQPVNTPDVPELFSCIGSGYFQNVMVGNYFKPTAINNIKGTLIRLVSGLTLDISNVPGYVSSITLVAEQLVSATRAVDGNPLLWQTPQDNGIKTIDKQIPVAGKVSFNKYMLPTLDARKTLFYLDVSYGAFTERYTMKVTDTPGIASGNRITFTPNHWVKITGDYAKINLGFTITGVINLDDNAWDGIQYSNP
ncbi:MAG: hypothetical protein PUB21_08230 [Bacteroidales bacterium]|nr:hypothetical protein [Bacteroidales bacterium]